MTSYLIKEYSLFGNDIVRNESIALNLHDARLIVKELQDTINARNYSKEIIRENIITPAYVDTTKYSWTEEINEVKIIKFIAHFIVDLGEGYGGVNNLSRKHIEIIPFENGVIYDRHHNDSPMSTNI